MTAEQQILSQLNESQCTAVVQVDGPVMVIAGAGSGKTRVLTYRIAYMLTQGINPYRILALTFTNKAAGEMKERIFQLVGNSNAKAVMMGTFHGVFNRIIQVEHEKLGFMRNITVYDTDDAKNLLKSIVKEMNLDPKTYVASHVLHRISSAKSSLISADDYAKNIEILEADRINGKPYISEIFKRYNNRLKSSNAMDFDDLLYYMNVLLRDFPEILHKYQNRFQYILVDEYQDTNFAQYLIVKKLAAAHHNICVVGDDAQSIYAFRGANIQNILNFKKDYPESKTFKLEQNYRSTKHIVNAANAVIKNNQDQLHKEVWTENEEGHQIEILKTNSDTDEAQTVAHSIFETKQNYQKNNAHFAILYRTNAQSRALEEALIKKNIPYIVYGGISFYKRKEIKDVIAYFRLTINHYDEESLRRVINYPMRGIGATTVDKIIVCAQENNTRVWDVVEKPDLYHLDVNAPTKARLQDVAIRIKSYSAMLTKTDAYELGNHIVATTGIMQELNADKSEIDRLQNVESLLNSMKEFTEREPESLFNEDTGEIITDYYPSLDRFVESISTLIDDDEKKNELQDRVKLMTIHSAKGLEFDYVYVTGLEENLFPSSMSLGTRAELEEERRLFYVAITRARKKLTLTSAQTRYRFGNLQFCEESRFLHEIPVQFIHKTQKASMGRNICISDVNEVTPSHFIPINEAVHHKRHTHERKPTQKVGKEARADQIYVGLRVYHDKFGYGKVAQTDSEGLDKKAVVTFDSVGNKTLLLKFAKLVIP
ncbi:MAG: UvrD-helicase domain-containing protein [Bacteroidales bacterium]|jgi:DNA helicase-2/ATP-dependent DNA helicase PcrA|nr:UvrD-helicase domain-containing protein [Bacteroidales bacterium]